MANLYSQMYVQIVFAVLGRVNIVSETHRIFGVAKYILNHTEHHKKRTFREAYLAIRLSLM